MITALKAPASLALSGNAMLFEIKVTDSEGYVYGPVNYRFVLRLSAAKLPADAQIFLRINVPPFGKQTTTLPFLAKGESQRGAPNLNWIPDDTWDEGSLDDYFILMASVMETYEGFAPFFRTSLSQDSGDYLITFEAQPGYEDYTISVVGGLPSGVTSEEITETEPDNTPEGLAVRGDLTYQPDYEGAPFEYLAGMVSVPDIGGIVRFDISSILHKAATAKSEVPIPDFAQASLFRPDNLRRYQAVFYEREEDPSSRIIGSGRIMIGGASVPVIQAAGDFFDSMGADNAFLTWRPDHRTILEAEPAFITWYNYTGAQASVALQVVEYSDEDTIIRTRRIFLEGAGALSVWEGECVTIPLRPASLALLDDTAKFTIRVMNAVDLTEESEAPEFLSQIRTYYIDRDYYEDPRFLIYTNSFGCPECIACTGEFSESDSVERFVTEVLNRPDAVDLREIYQYMQDWTPGFTYRTGHIPVAERQALRQAWLSGSLYEVYPDGYIPLQVTGDEADVTSTRQSLHSITFECVPRFRMRNYSNFAIAVENIPPCGEDSWHTVAQRCWRLAFGSYWQLES